ncbi:unnamed protein product [Clavelina lepadiformis]|uniref:GT23 domain-containing protein n=1 Tax=Clavelina lepadiformis TaxID=159417 RepID=A0ABP0FWS8_CLALP
MFIYNYVKQYNRPTSVRRILVFPTSTINSETRPVKATFSERQNKDQFTFQGARSLIVGAYSEALQVKEFARKYFSKDLDLTTKSALEEDYSRNYLPFKDLTRKIQALVDAIYSQSHDNLTILGDLVQKRIQKLQNPSDCKTAKKLICKFPRCGLGCQFHHIGKCLLVALGTNRVMLVNNKNVHYKGIEKVFLPLSKTCSSEDISMKVVEWLGESQLKYEDIAVVSLDAGSAEYETYFKAFTIPKSLQERIEVLHDDPNLWWIGQIMRYLFRPSHWITDKVQQIKQKINLVHPYVSIHVRRTDKHFLEAKRVGIDKYMEHIIDWFDNRLRSASSSSTRNIYVASDDLAHVIPDARRKYPNYDFLYQPDDKKSLKDMRQGFFGRETEEELVSLVGRFVTELMHSAGDATFRSRSVDEGMYYHQGFPIIYRAIESHLGGNGELSFSAGEKIFLQPLLAGSLQYKGFGTKVTGQYGSFPMHKVEQLLTTVPYVAITDI